ncbi:hypothetical protein F4808DRAFT_11437 [Astrocystis sublimbata]|nr:hypothetical protein F4808DRAFT_11437 [Astrocystis sublimbata]
MVGDILEYIYLLLCPSIPCWLGLVNYISMTTLLDSPRVWKRARIADTAQFFAALYLLLMAVCKQSCINSVLISGLGHTTIFYLVQQMQRGM